MHAPCPWHTGEPVPPSPVLGVITGRFLSCPQRFTSGPNSPFVHRGRLVFHGESRSLVVHCLTDRLRPALGAETAVAISFCSDRVVLAQGLLCISFLRREPIDAGGPTV